MLNISMSPSTSQWDWNIFAARKVAYLIQVPQEKLNPADYGLSFQRFVDDTKAFIQSPPKYNSRRSLILSLFGGFAVFNRVWITKAFFLEDVELIPFLYLWLPLWLIARSTLCTLFSHIYSLVSVQKYPSLNQRQRRMPIALCSLRLFLL